MYFSIVFGVLIIRLFGTALLLATLLIYRRLVALCFARLFAYCCLAHALVLFLAPTIRELTKKWHSVVWNLTND